MQKDCHYYGTYYVARLAGFDDNDARSIAWAAQTVDEMNHDTVADQIYKKLCAEGFRYQSDKNIDNRIDAVIDSGYNLVTVTTDVSYLGSVSPEAINDSGNDAIQKMIRYAWVPFHFLPIGKDERDNCKFNDKACSDVAASTHYEYAILSPSIFGRYATQISAWLKLSNIAKYISNTNDDIYYVCQTSTNLCKSMIEEAKKYYQNESNDEISRLYRIGICMHVLADTWSHQGFCGSNNMFINHVHLPIKEIDKGTVFLGYALDSNLPLSPAWTGHGSAGCNPDIPGLAYDMTYDYLNTVVHVDNVDRFTKAFAQMYSALCYIKNENETFDFNFQLKEDIVTEIQKNFSDESDEDDRIKRWKKTIQEKTWKKANGEEKGIYISYSKDVSDERILDFMKVARLHRNFIMGKIGYDQSLKIDNTVVNDYVDRRFKEEMHKSVKSCFKGSVGEAADHTSAAVQTTVKKIEGKYDNFCYKFFSGCAKKLEDAIIRRIFPY